MSDLVQFLRDRLDEDFEAVRLVLGVNVMAAIRHGEPAPRWVPSPKSDAGVWDANRQPRVKHAWPRERDHIIRHDPARVLAEIEAKRRILTALDAATTKSVGAAVGVDAQDGLVSGLHHAARQLAAVYADHPDYRAEWRAGEDPS